MATSHCVGNLLGVPLGEAPVQKPSMCCPLNSDLACNGVCCHSNEVCSSSGKCCPVFKTC